LHPVCCGRSMPMSWNGWIGTRKEWLPSD
jgi:hypothetical protein